jgi:serine/threonine-protein kinase RsbT
VKVRLRALVSLLGCEVVCGEDALDRDVSACFAADLMSDALAFSSAHTLLITGLATVQSVHTANVTECAGLLLVSRKKPTQDALQLGLVKDIPILSTPRSMFEVCGMLYEHGMREPAPTIRVPSCPEPPMEEQVLYCETFAIRGGDFEHGGSVAARVKAILKELGYPPDVVRRLSIANFEAEMNLVMYAEEGELELVVTPEAIRVRVSDRGQGIPDISWAMEEGHSTATPEMRERGFGAGLGLPNIKRSSDSFAISSTVGVGTRLDYAVLTPGATEA